MTSPVTGSGGTPYTPASPTVDRPDQMGKDVFMKLLVAQMKNQDPLNPLDNAQVTTQLAQINTVKGIDKMNTALSKLVDGGQAGSTTDAAAMVGRSVLVEGSTLELPADGVARAGYELSAAASSVRVDVLDRSGAVVDSIQSSNVAAGLQTFSWDGTAGGRTLDPGTYRIRVTATNGNDSVESTPLTAAPVQAVLRGTDGVSLQLGTFGTRPLDQVRAIL